RYRASDIAVLCTGYVSRVKSPEHLSDSTARDHCRGNSMTNGDAAILGGAVWNGSQLRRVYAVKGRVRTEEFAELDHQYVVSRSRDGGVDAGGAGIVRARRRLHGVEHRDVRHRIGTHLDHRGQSK